MELKDFRLLVVVVFAVGMSVFFIRLVLGDGTKPVFHEMEWDSRVIAAKMVEQMAHDSTLADATIRPIQQKDSSKSPATAADRTYSKALAGLRQKIAGLNDSLWEHYAATRLFPDPDSISARRMTDSGLNNVRIVYMDTSFGPGNYSFNTTLPLKKYTFFEAFIAKYPIFGAWALLIVIQMISCILIFPWLALKIFGKADPCAKDIEVGGYVKLIYVLAIMGVFYVLYQLIFRDGVDSVAMTKDQYFMFNLTHVFRVANGLGYVVAGLCIAGMLFTILEIGKLGPGAPSADVVKYLDGRLKLYFTIVAIVLSLAVFTTGTLFSALNSMDLVCQLTKAIGYSPFPSDFVVLYGLIHTFALMLFYVPAKYMMDSLKANMVPAPEPQDWSQLKKLGGLAVASSPLLAGIFQSMLDVIAK